MNTGRKMSLALALAAVALGLAACDGSCGGTREPEWSKIIKDSPTPTPQPPAPKTSSHMVVYLDTSASMAGYVSPDRQGQTVFSRSLQELRNFITIVSPPLDVVVRRVDSTISQPYPDSYLSEASINPAAFNGKETDIAGAISSFEKPVAAAPKQAAVVKAGAAKDDDEPDKPPPARFHVLVTDGVQSRTKQSADASCLAGSDQTCVRKRLLDLLGKGWGGYVIGLRSEFQGKVYSEVSRGAVVAYQSKRRDPQSFRPFYIYVFSPDRRALDDLVSTLVSRLKPLLADDGGMRTLALTSDYAQGYAQADLVVPKESSRVLTSAKSGRHADPAGLTLRVDVSTEKSGPAPFQIVTSVPWAANVSHGGTPQELTGLLSWSLTPVFPESAGRAGERYPEVKITGQSADADGRVVLDASAQFPGGKTGAPRWRAYLLEGRLNLKEQTPPWIRQWSTNLDTTTDAANKTLYLESTLLGLWNNPQLEKQSVARIYLRVGP